MTTTNNNSSSTKADLERSIVWLEEKRDEYVTRLDDGAVKIEEARKQGKDVTLWENYWIQLLRQYEAVCGKLREKQEELATLQPA